MNELPDELLEHIFNAIDERKAPYQPIQCLASLCLINRNLHRITTPLLYQNIARAAPFYWRVDKRPLFYKCLKTLWTQPELRTFVKQIKDIVVVAVAKENQAALKNTHDIVQSDDTDPQALIVALAEELDLPDTEGLLARRAHGEDIWPALCCLLAPNLERVNILARGIVVEEPPPSLLLEYICRSALGTPLGKVHSFDKLRVLHVEAGFHPCFPITYAYPLLLLPRLETLILGDWGASFSNGYYTLDDNDSTIFDKPFTWPQRVSPITELSLRRPLTTVGPASKMIRACEKLVKFESTSIESIGMVGRPREYWYDHISAALQEHCDSLREISIWEEFSSIFPPSSFGSLHSLQRMTCLVRLRVPCQILMGYNRVSNTTLPDWLPRTIETLTIELFDDPQADLELAFTDLHTQCVQGRFSAFKHVHLIWRLMTAPRQFAFDIEKVSDLYATGQVRFDVTIHCSEAMKPKPMILSRYEELFPAYV